MKSCGVTLLLLSAATLFGQTAPDPSEVLESAREKIHATMKGLPRYACLQTIDRTYYAPSVLDATRVNCDQIDADRKKGRKPVHVNSTDRLRLEVAHVEDHEIHAYPAASRFDLTEIDQIVDNGPFGTGAFGGYLVDIFDNDGTRYDYRGTQTRDGKQFFVYGYGVAESVSHYEIRAGAGWVNTAYSGTFEIDPRTFEIARLTVLTSELPAESSFCEADSTLEYQRVEIGQGTFLLPKQNDLHLFFRDGRETNNTMVFGGCREFHAESAVLFESPEGKPAGKMELPKAPSAPRPPLPAQLGVDLRMANAIDTDTAAAGDLVTATVVHDVRVRRSFDTLIPAGAIVHGRVSRIEHHLVPSEYLYIGLTFESVEFDGEVSPFFARTELPDHFTGTAAVAAARVLAPRMPPPPPDALVFPHEKRHVMPAGTVIHWITWTKP